MALTASVPLTQHLRCSDELGIPIIGVDPNLTWLRGQKRRVVTFSMLKVVDISVSKAHELKSLSSLVRAGADSRDFLSI